MTTGSLSDRETAAAWEQSALRRGGIRFAVLRTVVSFGRRKPLGAAGAVVVIALVLTALLAPLIAPYDPNESVTLPLSGMSWSHPFGADHLGRDMLSRVIYGARISLQIGLIAVAIGVVGGSAIGLLSAYAGGVADLAIQRLMDTAMCFPTLILALIIVTALGTEIHWVMIAVGIAIIPSASRVVRSVVLSLKELSYIEAARSMGAGSPRIVLRHLLPNAAAPIIVIASASLGNAILSEAALSFLGLGAQPPAPAWGSMLSGQGRLYFEVAPWLGIFPGVAISLTVLGFNLFGDALRDVLDPRLRGSR